jgi:hypothetical protein
MVSTVSPLNLEMSPRFEAINGIPPISRENIVVYDPQDLGQLLNHAWPDIRQAIGRITQ